MDTYSQMLCRFKKTSSAQTLKLGFLAHLCVYVCTGWSLIGTALAASETQASPALVQPQKAQSAIPTAQVNLLESARDWISKRTAIAFEDIQMNVMDERLKVTPCDTSTLFDQPFANRHVIRARCDQPRWQYFLQASWPQSLDKHPTNAQTKSLQGNASHPLMSPNPNNVPQAAPIASSAYPLQAPSAQNGNIYAEVVRTVLVLNQPLKKGTILNSSQFKKISLNVPQGDGQILTQTQEIENWELLHDMGSDQMIHSFDVKPSVMVKRGQEVTLVFGQGRGFTITVKTEALQDGTLGEQVKLKNVDSGRIISGVVTGFSEAKGI